MIQTFTVTSPEFWREPSGDIYYAGGWRSSFMLGSQLQPNRTTYYQDEYTYEYVVYDQGHTFWDTYADAFIKSIRIEGVNLWVQDETFVFDISPLTTNDLGAVSSVNTTSYAQVTLLETRLLSQLTFIQLYLHGDTYYSGNGIFLIQLELDVPTSGPVWRNHRRVVETIE